MKKALLRNAGRFLDLTARLIWMPAPTGPYNDITIGLESLQEQGTVSRERRCSSGAGCGDQPRLYVHLNAGATIRNRERSTPASFQIDEPAMERYRAMAE
jgi:hypothetical protein